MREPATHTVLAILVVILFATSYVMPYFILVPAGDAGMLITGTNKVIETVVVWVFGYYFGSSKSSARKDELLADRATPPPPNDPAFTIPEPKP